MPEPALDPSDLEEFRAFLDKRGMNPNDFHLAASPADPAEGELAPSRRTATVSHLPTGRTMVYGVRTWVADFKADTQAGQADYP